VESGRRLRVCRGLPGVARWSHIRRSHAGSIRFAAIRADELLKERTLPYDEEQVEQLLRRWPSVRCCDEAGPTGFGLYRIWSGAGSSARRWRRGWRQSGRAIGSRPIRATRAGWRGCMPAGCWSRSTFPRPSWRPHAISCVRVRTRGLIGCATAAAVEALSAPRAAAADERLDGDAAQVDGRAAVRAYGLLTGRGLGHSAFRLSGQLRRAVTRSRTSVTRRDPWRSPPENAGNADGVSGVASEALRRATSSLGLMPRRASIRA
jgi:hypothetical protein